MSDALAIDGGSPVRDTPYPQYVAPAAADDAAPIEAFEAELTAAYGGQRIAIACGGRLDALALALAAVRISEGEIVVPTLRGETAAEAVIAAGLTAVPGDVDPEAVNLSARGFARAKSEATKGVIVTHAFGHATTMTDIVRLTENESLAIIEDMSESLGASFAGNPVGGLGHAAAMGFGDGHILTGGGATGGVVLVGEAVADEVRAARDAQASALDPQAFAVAVSELRQSDHSLQVRREAAWQLTEQLRGIKGVQKMSHGRWIRHGYDSYVVRLRSMLWHRSIAETVAALQAEGIPCEQVLGPSLHRDPRIRQSLGDEDARLTDRDFATTAKLPEELIAIPLAGVEHPSDVGDIAAALRKIEAASEAEPTERTA
ncbi:MAG TPA: DegT/DnrJ/EryC1/StrS family aminotransferase [Dehalococcoidia bacterium]|nr:DegT/DnrJ/EryC1/StrS family aminotransferase [Dehalococcoidia bacterium]